MPWLFTSEGIFECHINLNVTVGDTANIDYDLVGVSILDFILDHSLGYSLKSLNRSDASSGIDRFMTIK